MKEQVFLVDEDNFYSTGTLAEFQACLWDEQNLYHVKDGFLYYDKKLIGTPIKGDE